MACTQGVWDVMSDDDTREVILANAALSNDEVASAVVQTALVKGTRDNVSCLVVRLR